MKLICDQCGAKYSIADEKVRGKVFKIRCKKCQNVIVVRGTDQAAEAAGSAPAAEGAASPSAGADPEPVWYVVIGREQVGPLTDLDLEGKLSSGEVSGDSFVWQEGFSDWVQLSTVDRFQAAVAATASQAEAPAAEDTVLTHQPTDDIDEPTQAIAAFDLPGTEEPAAPAADLFGAQASTDDDEATSIVAGPAMAAAIDAGMSAPEVSASVAPAAAADAAATATMDDGLYDAPFSGFGGADPDPGAGPLAAPPPDSPQMVGARSENSVLFSLQNLQSLAVGEESSGAAPPSTSSVSDASGLIDVRALAEQAGVDPGLDDIAGDGAPAFPAAPAAPVMIPMVRRRSNTGLIVGGILGAALIITGGVVGGLYLLKGKKGDPGSKGTAVAKATASKAGKSESKPAEKADDEEAKTDDKEDEGEEKVAVASASKAKKKKKKGRGKAASRSKSAAATSREPAKSASAPKQPKPRAAPTRRAPAAKSGGSSSIDSLLDNLGSSKKKSSSSKRAKAPTKKAAPAAGGGSSKLSRSQIQGVVRKNGGKIKSCNQRQPEPKLTGTVKVSFTIQPNGRVKGASIKTPKFAKAAVGRCVLSAVSSFRFPSHSGAPMKINYPFILR